MKFIILSILTVYGFSAASATKINGYVDVQAQAGRGQIEVQKDIFYAGEPGLSFAVHKGAFEFQHSHGVHNLHIDIPFHQTRTLPEDNNNLDIAQERAQAYVGMTLPGQWEWKLGQFDTPWGLEGNDTNTIHYRNLGILYDATPNTNLGFVLTRIYSSQWKALLFLGNSNQSARQDLDKELEQGVQFIFENDNSFFKLGVLFNQRKGSYVVNTETYEFERGALVDLQWGSSNGFELNAIYIHPDNQKVSHNGSIESTKGTYGLLLNVPLFSTSIATWALRAEWLKNDRTNEFISSLDVSGNESEIGKISLGRLSQLDEVLSVKVTLDYFHLNIGENGQDNQWVEGAIAAVYGF